MARAAFVVILILLLSLQYKFWFGKGGMTEKILLEKELAEQVEKNKALKARNLALKAEISDLQNGLSAVEAQARRELGLVKEGETFYQILSDDKTETP